MITPFDACPSGAEWRLLPINDHYEISEYGHLRRSVSGSNSYAGKLIKPQVDVNGRATYQISRERKKTTVRIHRMVALAFIGAQPPHKPVVAHEDGIPLNCHHANLRWATYAENADDRDRHGKTSRGETHPFAKLTEDSVRMIRESAESIKQLSARLGVDRTLITKVRKRLIWQHVS